jgi:hypothetical protein
LLHLIWKGKGRGVFAGSTFGGTRPIGGAPADDEPSDPGVPPSPPIEPAPPKVHSPIPDFDSPAIVAMERRALRQIFDHLDLVMVPGLAFVALEQTRNPVKAFKLFATWVGVDPLAARDRVDDALLRLALAIELLSELGPFRELLTKDGDRRISDALRDTTAPDPLSRLRSQMERVAAAAKLHRIGKRMGKLPSCILVSRMQAIINEIIGDPLATERLEIEDGIGMAERLEAALRDLGIVEADVIRDLEELGKAYSEGTLSVEHAAWCDGQRDAFERLFNEIESDDSLGVIEIEERVKRAERIRDSLLTMRGRSGGDPGRRGPTPEEEIDDAFVVLGLSPTSDWRAIERCGNALRKKHNTDDPDHRATPEQQRANTERMQQINTAMDCLRKYKDRLADLMA